ncbi:hypothetical protein [Halorussus ruber]|uniref:hypothetical protein n=1 Tax=Halorussus ruber TaxID=1126238 RepID=UPI00109289BC|nr:hypothetical protein [Halorussus ruber]
MTDSDLGDRDRSQTDREWPGCLLPPSEVPDDAPIVDLTDEANARWLDDRGPSSTPFTELSDDELEAFDQTLEDRLREIE